MKYFSTFSGIGGFELGIKQAYEICNANRSEDGRSQEDTQGDKGQGFQSTQGQETSTEERPASKCDNDITDQRPLCVGYSEIDKYAQQIYQAHFPNHKNYGDITKIDAASLPDFDLLVGGFPCQAFSIAGKRAGFDDTRGTMFFELARIIKEKLPHLFVFENVKGLLSHDQGKTFTTIITTLDELGYDCQWQVLNSKNHGVPQNRERVFIIGHLRGTRRPQVFPFGSSDQEDTDSGRLHKTDKGRTTQSEERPEEVEHTRDSHNEEGGKVSLSEHKSHSISQLNYPKMARNRVYGTEGISSTLQTGTGGGHTPFILDEDGETWIENKVRRLTPTECERLQGFPDGWTKKGVEYLRANGDTNGLSDLHNEIEISDTQRYKTLGNAVTVNVIKNIIEHML